MSAKSVTRAKKIIATLTSAEVMGLINFCESKALHKERAENIAAGNALLSQIKDGDAIFSIRLKSSSPFYGKAFRVTKVYRRKKAAWIVRPDGKHIYATAEQIGTKMSIHPDPEAIAHILRGGVDTDDDGRPPF